MPTAETIRRREQKLLYYVANRDKFAARAKKYNNNGTRRDKRLRYLYGLTYAQYLEMYKIQNGLCAICHKWFEKLCIDHCHKSGKIRALLCFNCNTGLGSFKDDFGNLQAAAEYLADWA